MNEVLVDAGDDLSAPNCTIGCDHNWRFANLKGSALRLKRPGPALGSNRKLKVQFEPSAAVWGKFLRFGLICNL